MSTPASPATALRDVVVVGASAGAVAALTGLAGQLPARFPAALLVVLHTGPHPSRLAGILDRSGRNPAVPAIDGEPLRSGHIHVAVPDHHLLVRDGLIRLTRGAKEHHTRPAIDPLFRTAALWAGPRVIGVVLSGCNDDGSAGLAAVKSCGGIAVVQDPDDADEPAMPRSALHSVAVDHCVSVARLGPLLTELSGQPVAAAGPAPERLRREQSVSVGEGNPM